MVDDPSSEAQVVVTDAGGDVHVVKLVGEFEHAGCGRLLAATAHLAALGRRHVLIDASEVTFASSALLRVMLQLRKAIVAAHGTVHIAPASPALQRVLDITGCGVLFVDESADERTRRLVNRGQLLAALRSRQRAGRAQRSAPRGSTTFRRDGSHQ
jgi:anti-anti-sigma factor